MDDLLLIVRDGGERIVLHRVACRLALATGAWLGAD
jgi:hypothetical protein